MIRPTSAGHLSPKTFRGGQWHYLPGVYAAVALGNVKEDACKSRTAAETNTGYPVQGDGLM